MSKTFFSIIVLSLMVCSVGGIGSVRAGEACKANPHATLSTQCPGNCKWTCMAEAVKPGCGCEEHAAGSGPGLLRPQ